MSGPLSEFDLIRRYFASTAPALPDPWLGIGDDTALLPPADGALAVTTDTLIAGVHFFPEADPYSVGHKSLAVSLSDLAAMGAKPTAFVLAIGVDHPDEVWLREFSRGLFDLATRAKCPLVGGDTVRVPRESPAMITITAFGSVEPLMAMRRDRAQVGDDVWVSGTLGDAWCALQWRRGSLSLEPEKAEWACARMDRPEPRNALGQALAPLAHASVDVSDGFWADLGHILDRSGVGVEVDIDKLPMAEALADLPLPLMDQARLMGGDDYELIITAPLEHRDRIASRASELGVPLSRVGRITSPLTRVLLRDGIEQDASYVQGHDHFVENH